MAFPFDLKSTVLIDYRVCRQSLYSIGQFHFTLLFYSFLNDILLVYRNYTCKGLHLTILYMHNTYISYSPHHFLLLSSLSLPLSSSIHCRQLFLDCNCHFHVKQITFLFSTWCSEKKSGGAKCIFGHYSG